MKQRKTSNGFRQRYIAKPNLFAFVLTASLFFLTQCKKEIKPESESSDVPAVATKKPGGPVIVVNAGGSIQAAVDAASAGTTIKIQPGTYKESIEVNKPGITLDGTGQVVIQNPGGKANGITVRDAGDGFVLKNVTLREFGKNGIILIRVDGFLLSHVTAIDNGEYGLYPVHCSNGVIEHCKASGHSDTGIYVGQSTHVNINQNEAEANVNGIEVENCSFVSVDKNHTHNNVVGIMSVLLPRLNVKTASDIRITNNQVRENNLKNFADDDELEAAVPSGSGILIVGTDNTLVQDNHVMGNNFVGIAVVSSLVLGILGNLPPSYFDDIEPNPDGVRVVSNQVIKNGTGPDLGPFPAVDLLWDGSGTNNCWSRNLYNTATPKNLPACQ